MDLFDVLTNISSDKVRYKIAYKMGYTVLNNQKLLDNNDLISRIWRLSRL
jgi:hypothetical protein